MSSNLLGQKKIKQPLGTKNKTRNLFGPKITQPRGTKKSHNLWGQIKSHNLSGQKKITQPLGTTKRILKTLWTTKNPATSWDQNKSRNIWGEKNHATSQEKKSRKLSGQKNITKNHATSWDKKITQPLGTKKITEPWDKKNHATSQDKKATLSIGPIASKLVHKAPNCSKWHQICPNRSK